MSERDVESAQEHREHPGKPRAPLDAMPLAMADPGDLFPSTLPDTAALAPDPRTSVVGRLLGLVDDGTTPLITLGETINGVALRARSTVDLRRAHVGASVLLTFEGGDAQRPIVIGVLRGAHRPPDDDHLEVRYEGGRVLLIANSELVLRCGKSSLTLHQDGHVELHGDTITTRATGANKVQGGSVQLN